MISIQFKETKIKLKQTFFYVLNKMIHLKDNLFMFINFKIKKKQTS